MRAAYGARTAPLKSYSFRISSDAVLRMAFFMTPPLSTRCRSRTDQPNSVVFFGERDYQQTPLVRYTLQQEAILVNRTVGISHHRSKRILERRGGLEESHAVLASVAGCLSWVP